MMQFRMKRCFVLRRVLWAAVIAAGLGGADPALAQAGAAAQPTIFSSIIWPFQAAGNWLGGWLQSAEALAVTEKRLFATTLKNDFSRFETLVGEAGFKVTEVAVSGGFSPEIAMVLELRRNISSEEEAALRRKIDALTQSEGFVGRIERELLLALLDIDEAATAVRPDGFALSELEIEVDLFPGFTYRFTRGES